MDKREKYIQENIQEIILNLISKVWSDYCAELKKEPLPIVDFSITDNISEEYKKIRPDHAKKFPSASFGGMVNALCSLLIFST